MSSARARAPSLSRFRSVRIRWRARRMHMRSAIRWTLGSATASVALVLAACAGMEGGGAGISIGASDLGGVVTGARGPEAGVWVIAETTDLPTKFTRIVVTDEHGR